MVMGITMCIFALTGEEILARMDKNRDYKTITYSGTMVIHVNNQARTKTMKTEALNREETKAIVEFTNPEDNGTKYLMLGENLWIYFPEENDVVKISGHMLKEGMMGSDVSYEDALESDRLSDKYTIVLSGEDKINNHDCHVITLDAKVKDVPYHKRKMWVTKDTYISYKEEMYAKSGKLLKVANVLETKVISGRQIPVKTEMVNMLRRDSKTVFEMKEIVFDRPMDESMFSMRYLRR
jgi:outer membrane lipoprotein-sorting protein